jgi:hypothetical protein
MTNQLICLCLPIIALLLGSPFVGATSVVVLGNATQIGVAADHKAGRTNGTNLPDICHRELGLKSNKP